MRSHYTRGLYAETGLCDTFPDSMRLTFVALLAAAAIAVAAFAPVGYPPRLTEAAASDGYSAISSGDAYMGVQLQQNDEPDRTELILWTLAASGAAAVLALIGYVIRLRVGFFPHRPPPRDGSAPEDHH
jgi:hypothetical protein